MSTVETTTTITTTKTTDETSWLELLGSNNWDGLLDPFGLSLCRLILKCGDFCQSTHDGFNYDANSKYAGSCRYGKSSFFRKLMLLEFDSDYQVETFLYATAQVKTWFFSPWDKDTNWIGYIAVSTDDASKALGRREIYVVWRGTETSYEGKSDLDASPTSADPLLRPGSNGPWPWDQANVMNGWLTIYLADNPDSQYGKLSARTQLQNKIQELTERYKNESLSIIVTGYSLGAALGTLAAFDLAENVVDENVPVAAFVFESPKVGNDAFGRRVGKHPNLKILRVWNKNDIVPDYPFGSLLYSHTGIEFEVDTKKSPYLKDDKIYQHNLESVLHVVAGWNGKDGEFDLKVKRSLALVNRSNAALKDELMIPEAWWAQQNKGMVLDDNGDWILPPPSDEDVPDV